MMKITIESRPHNQQRYDTGGDWYQDDEGIHIIVSELSSVRLEHLVAVHELVEMILCKWAGITQEEVDAFDMKHQEEQKDGVELGDLEYAPYRKQHCFATAVERMLAAELGVIWSEYEHELMGLS